MLNKIELNILELNILKFLHRNAVYNDIQLKVNGKRYRKTALLQFFNNLEQKKLITKHEKKYKYEITPKGIAIVEQHITYANIYNIIKSYINKNNFDAITPTSLAFKLKISRQAVHQNIKKLKDLGYISYQSRDYSTMRILK